MIRVMKIRERSTWQEAGLLTVVVDALSTAWNLMSVFIDGLVLLLPKRTARRQREVAFIFHSPNEYHLFTPFPLLRYLPQPWVLWFTKHLPPCRLGEFNRKDEKGKIIGRGRMYGCLVCPEHFFATDPAYAVSIDEVVALVKRAARLARWWGAHTVGLGAYLPTMMNQGRLLADDPEFRDLRITTGHQCTVAVVKQYLYKLARDLGIDLTREQVAVVGAAGTTGRAVARALAAANGLNLLLVDLPKKREKLTALAEECELSSSGRIVHSVNELSSGVLKSASVVIVLTTALGSIINPEDLGPSTVIIDDSKPRNTNPETLGELIADGRVLVVDVLAEVPGLNIGFHYDLAPGRPWVTYTCGADLQLRSMSPGMGSCVGDVTPTDVRGVEAAMARASIGLAPLTSFSRLVTREEVNRFRQRRVAP